MSKKNNKRGNESITYFLVLLVSVIIILLAVLGALLIKPSKNELYKAPEIKELINEEHAKRLRFWSVILEVWNEAGMIEVIQ